MRTSGLHVVRHHVGAPGFPVVLVHGAPDRSKSFAHVVHRLSDLAVTVYDRRGYGKSLAAGTGPDGELIGGFAEHAEDLIELLDGRPSVVVGQSAGGTLAMHAAAKAPELFAALGVWEPPPVNWSWWPPYSQEQTHRWADFDDPRALGETFNRMMLGDDLWESIREQTRELLRSEGAAFQIDMACQIGGSFDLDRLTMPFVVGWGTGIMPQYEPNLARLARETSAEAFVTAGVNHQAHSSAPEVWTELVRRTVAAANRAEHPS